MSAREGPEKIYHELLKAGTISADDRQQKVINALQNIFMHTLQANKQRNHRLKKIKQWMGKTSVEQGLYIWGGVGRGKTFLMDMFFEAIPFQEKRRVHFHHFMQEVHQGLDAIKNKKNPLKILGRKIAQQTQILCLDEFVVTDIADAMLLSGLIKSLLDNQVMLLLTSNMPPDDLYKNGLQRVNFLPAIDLLKQHLDVCELDGPTDYRLELLEASDLYFTPASLESDNVMQSQWSKMVNGKFAHDVMEPINGRDVLVRCVAKDLIWFDFESLCGGPRGKADYIEIACCYHTVFISGVWKMGKNCDDVARRFVSLIDVLYDHSVKILLSADAEPMSLYEGGNLEFEFKRTISRLEEMRSHDYMKLAHRP
ncbi:MAG: AFG1 family ATPase [Gammaproteobacteria bacterium]|nr:AFG1 family ATPase [Gammaproteobacteria bacterium]